MALFERMKELADKFNSIKTDRERLVFLKEHNDVFKVSVEDFTTKVLFINSMNVDKNTFQKIIDELPLNGVDDSDENVIMELYRMSGIMVHSENE